MSTPSSPYLLTTDHTAYSFGLNARGMLAHAYWGPRLPRPSDYPPPPDTPEWASFNGPEHNTPLEFPAWAGTDYTEPCLKASFVDGTRDCVLRFVSASQQGDGLRITITLRDAFYPLWVELHYTAHPRYDLIERSVTLRNSGSQPVRVERLFSALWHLPRREQVRFTHLSGRWAGEFALRREWLNTGVKCIESRRLNTSHQASPWFALDTGAGEDSGEVWFGTLAWSGSWKLLVEQTDFGAVRAAIGLNDWDFALELAPGEQFAAPASLAGYTQGGFGGASRALHAYLREQVLPHRGAAHPVLYNAWEAAGFVVDEPSQMELAEIAAGLGVELFVLDDGWFHRRDSDAAGLGDWRPDARKFPCGLRPLAERANQLGMDFGLWLEPEMVNPDSELYRAHPDWILRFPNRVPTQARNQLMLNLARQDVQEYLIGTLDRLLSSAPIAFVKWDHNRNASEPGAGEGGGQRPEAREVWVRYVEGLYRVWGELARRHPHITWQSCSGGGGRADFGILSLADQIWTSDNTEAVARLGIQEGFSQLFPASVMEAWVTDMGAARVPLEFRFHAAMCGSLGIGANLLRWSAAERVQAARLVAQYKEIRPIIQQGQQYRLRSPQDSAFSAVQYVSPDRQEGVLFAFRTLQPEPAILPPLYLRGLDPDALYVVEGFAGPRSGAAWMSAGLELSLPDLGSALRRITKIE